jgi:TatD DNase family protein
MATPFFDFHTHFEKPNAVLNLIVLDDTNLKSAYSSLLSAGIHPWYLSANPKKQLEVLQTIAVAPEILFIGECGLDRLKGAELSLQIEVFEKQIKLADRLHKPVIVHCVKAYSELLHLRKVLRPTMPWVIHGFNAKPQIADQVLSSGCFLSLGRALLTPESNANKVLKTMPIERLFIETDDSTTPIEQIYEVAANTLNITPSFLSDQIRVNFEKITAKPNL